MEKRVKLTIDFWAIVWFTKSLGGSAEVVQELKLILSVFNITEQSNHNHGECTLHIGDITTGMGDPDGT